MKYYLVAVLTLTMCHADLMADAIATIFRNAKGSANTLAKQIKDLGRIEDELASAEIALKDAEEGAGLSKSQEKVGKKKKEVTDQLLTIRGTLQENYLPRRSALEIVAQGVGQEAAEENLREPVNKILDPLRQDTRDKLAKLEAIVSYEEQVVPTLEKLKAALQESLSETATALIQVATTGEALPKTKPTQEVKTITEMPKDEPAPPPAPQREEKKEETGSLSFSPKPATTQKIEETKEEKTPPPPEPETTEESTEQDSTTNGTDQKNGTEQPDTGQTAEQLDVADAEDAAPQPEEDKTETEMAAEELNL